MDTTGIDVLLKEMQKIPEKSEKVVNRYLHGEGIEKGIKQIEPYIPVSHWQGRARNKKHARGSNPLVGAPINLGFIIRPKPKFNYLKYPDLAIGQSQHNNPIKFMENGIKRATPTLIDDLMGELTQEIQKILGGN